MRPVAAPAGRRPGRRLRWMLAGLLAVPVVELAGIVTAARWIGPGLTVLALLVGVLVGSVVIGRAATAVRDGLRPAAPRPDGVLTAPPGAGGALADAVTLFPAGLLLVFPGFLTDVAGLLLLVPAVRRAVPEAVWRRVLRRVGPLTGSGPVVAGTVIEGIVLDGRAGDGRAGDGRAGDGRAGDGRAGDGRVGGPAGP